MRKIVLSIVTMALIAAAASPAVAARSHHVRKTEPATTSEQFRNARGAVAQPSQPAWPYSGWSAPAGR
ncbi:acid phosphatase class B [Bradyrhizobium sp. USDA 377]